MADLKTKYMGLELKNPVIIGSSSLTSTVDSLKRAEDSGAGAVVLKSIFEEEITNNVDLEMKQTEGYLTTGDASLFLKQASRNNHIESYLNLVRLAKESLQIPVIASINCTQDSAWLDYVRLFSSCNADALELNCYKVASDVNVQGKTIEKSYFDIAKRSVQTLGKIPVSMKISWHFTSISNVAENLSEIGVKALVMFNHFFRPDIDINKVTIDSEHSLQPKGDYSETLRWTALLASEIKSDICASTGIRTWETLVKMLLAGAKAVQITSAVYEQGWNVVGKMISGLKEWMDRHSYAYIKDFNALLSQERIKNPAQWERAQFLKLYKV